MLHSTQRCSSAARRRRPWRQNQESLAKTCRSPPPHTRQHDNPSSWRQAPLPCGAQPSSARRVSRMLSPCASCAHRAAACRTGRRHAPALREQTTLDCACARLRAVPPVAAPWTLLPTWATCLRCVGSSSPQLSARSSLTFESLVPAAVLPSSVLDPARASRAVGCRYYLSSCAPHRPSPAAGGGT